MNSVVKVVQKGRTNHEAAIQRLQASKRLSFLEETNMVKQYGTYVSQVFDHAFLTLLLA
ncbi:MAG: hypothetical protein NVS4B12_13320 [Ktedonobacteraceae bacterium]